MIVNTDTISVSSHNGNFSGNLHYTVVIFIPWASILSSIHHVKGLWMNECGNKKMNQKCVSDKQFIALDDLQTSENMT